MSSMYKVKTFYFYIERASELSIQDKINAFLERIGDRIVSIDFISGENKGFAFITYKDDTE